MQTQSHVAFTDPIRSSGVVRSARNLLIAAVTLAALGLHGEMQTPSSAHPRVIVLLVVDQMRADYFARYADRFKDGFKRLADGGAVFSEARYPYASTKTAEAHALMLSGWSPSRDRDHRRQLARSAHRANGSCGLCAGSQAPRQPG